MLSLCRLCAKGKDDAELCTQVFDLQSKLSLCCGWKPSENEIRMPQKACGSCVEQLNRSWEFAEAVWTAEKQLQKLTSELNQAISTEFVACVDETEEISVEPIKVETVEYAAFTDDVADNFSSSSDSQDEDDASEHISNETTKKDSEKGSRKLSKSDPFLDVLNDNERLGDGTISANGVAKLEKLFPEMVTTSWSDCKFKCKKCNQTFNGTVDFFAHNRSMHADDIRSMTHHCFYCNIKVRGREYMLNRHIGVEHFPHLKFRCCYCTDYFWDAKKLTKHRNKHPDLQYKCEVCERTFLSKEMLYAHINLLHRKKVDSDKKFTCETCSKVFLNKYAMNRHTVQQHSGVELVCEQCGSKFKTKSNLKEHLASVHSTETPFPCNQCDKRFKTKHLLSLHVRHHEDSPKECTVCSKVLKNKFSLNLHMQTHSNVYRYFCKYCDRKFRFFNNFKSHERVHTKEKPFTCSHCDYRSANKQNLNNHNKRIHCKGLDSVKL